MLRVYNPFSVSQCPWYVFFIIHALQVNRSVLYVLMCMNMHSPLLQSSDKASYRFEISNVAYSLLDCSSDYFTDIGFIIYTIVSEKENFFVVN